MAKTYYTHLLKAQLLHHLVIKMIRRNNYSIVRSNYLLVFTINISSQRSECPKKRKYINTYKTPTYSHLQIPCKHPIFTDQ